MPLTTTTEEPLRPEHRRIFPRQPLIYMTIMVGLLLVGFFIVRSLYPRTSEEAPSVSALETITSENTDPKSVAKQAVQQEMKRLFAGLNEQNKVSLSNDQAWKRGGKYDYFRGVVKNNSTRPLQYWKVSAQYLNEYGDIVDIGVSDSDELLPPGAIKPFEIVHRSVGQANNIDVFIEQVEFAD